MNAIEIVSKIRSAGGSITSDGGEIAVSAPAGAISDEDRIVLAEQRSTLISILAPSDPEREAIRWADTPAADGALDQARREWAEIVDGSIFDQIGRTIEHTFASGGIEVSAKFDRAPEPILVETVQDGHWTEPGRGPFVIPAGTEGRLVEDLDQEMAGDPFGRREVQLAVSIDRKRGKDPVAVDIDGLIRVLDRSKITLKEAMACPNTNGSIGQEGGVRTIGCFPPDNPGQVRMFFEAKNHESKLAMTRAGSILSSAADLPTRARLGDIFAN